MKKNVIKHSFVATIAVFSIMLALPFMVGAKSVDAQVNANTNRNDTSQNSRTAAQKKLVGDNLKSCQNREKAINNIMNRVGDRAQKQLTLMERINERVQTFYADKNMSLGNYNELIANISVKKEVAEKAMNNVRVMNGEFNCGSDDPKGIATQFKSNAALQSGALNGYRDSIKALLVEVKSSYSVSMEEK